MTAEELARLPVLQKLSADALALIFSASREKHARDGEVLFRRGDKTDGMFLIVEGAVRVVIGGDGGAVQLAVLGAGDSLGEMSVLGREGERGADAISTGARLLFVPLDAIRELRARFPPDFAQAVLALSRQLVARLDATNGKLVERLLSERAEGMRRDLVVHDLRSPLASIESAVAALATREDVYGPLSAKQRTALVRVQKNVGFLRLLADSLLEVERSRLVKTQTRETTLEEVLTTCAGPLLAVVQPDRWLSQGDELEALQGTRLHVEETSALRTKLHADPIRLAQVCMNLIVNALRYTQGAVEVRARAEGGLVALEVQDHGAGIPQAMREEIFSPFKQRELLDRQLPVGKGFGLAGVREMVRSMNGTIRALDRDDGTPGARFRVELPAS